MKIVACGDIHAHKFTDFAEIDNITGNSRLTNIVKALNYMKDYCIENNINNILFSGDMMHKRGSVDTVVLNVIYNTISDIAKNTNIYLLVGNHDQYDSSDFPQHSLEVFKNIKNVYVLDKFEPIEIDNDVVVYPSPYSKNVELVRNSISLYAYSLDINKHNILLAHLGLSGAVVGNTNYAMQDSFSLSDLHTNKFQFCILGHYHKMQLMNDNTIYTGSLIQHNFGDEGNPNGFITIDIDTNKIDIVEIPNIPKFITVKDANQSNGLEGNYVRFQIPTDEIAKLEDNLTEGVKYRIEPIKEYKVEMRVDISHKMTNSQIVDSYCEQFNKDAKEVLLEILREVEQ